MGDASSIRRVNTTLPSPSGPMASSVRFYNNRIWYADGTSWNPLAVDSADGADVRVSWTQAAGATAAIYTVPDSMILTAVSESHATKSTTGGMTLQITRDIPGVSAGAGTALLSTGIPATTNINVVQSGTLVSTTSPILNPGDVLSLKLSGAAGSLANVTVVLTLRPAEPNSNTGLLTLTATTVPTTATSQSFFIADRAYRVVAAAEKHGTASSVSGTGAIFKDTGTTAAGAGTVIMSSTWNLTSAINTNVYATLSATQADYTLAAGDRLSYTVTATPTSYATPTLTVWLVPL